MSEKSEELVKEMFPKTTEDETQKLIEEVEQFCQTYCKIEKYNTIIRDVRSLKDDIEKNLEELGIDVSDEKIFGVDGLLPIKSFHDEYDLENLKQAYCFIKSTEKNTGEKPNFTDYKLAFDDKEEMER